MARQILLHCAVAGLSVFSLAVDAGAQEGRSIALVLDASGSMNAKLASGGTRIEAAKAAVAAFVEKLDPKVRRCYGPTATSPRPGRKTARTPHKVLNPAVIVVNGASGAGHTR
jgi:hypothetical protein